MRVPRALRSVDHIFLTARAKPVQVVTMATILGVLWSGPLQGACGHDDTEVTGTTEEMDLACTSIALVDGYFDVAGLSYDLKVSIVFRDGVEISLSEGSGKLAVLGSFDGDRNLVELTRWLAREPQQLPWDLTWSREVLLSTATHEIAHAAIQAILGEDSHRLAHPWQEFIAYVVQFELMNEAMRAQILARYSQTEAFSSPAAVNSITYSLDPALFGLSSYLFAKERGGAKFVASLISGDVDFGTDDMKLLGP